MRNAITCTALSICLALSAIAAADELPKPARDAVAAFEEDAQGIRAEAERKIEKQKAELIEKLKRLQDEYTRAGKPDEAVAVRDLLRRMVNQFPAGSKVDIEWNGTWWPGEVVEFKEGKWHIRYDNYDDTWNEWIDATRIRARSAVRRDDQPGRDSHRTPANRTVWHSVMPVPVLTKDPTGRCGTPQWSHITWRDMTARGRGGSGGK